MNNSYFWITLTIYKERHGSIIVTTSTKKTVMIYEKKSAANSRALALTSISSSSLFSFELSTDGNFIAFHVLVEGSHKSVVLEDDGVGSKGC